MFWIQIPFHGFRIPGTEFQSLMVDVGFRTPIVGEIPDSKTKFSWIPDSTSKTSRISESGFSYMGRSVPGVTLKDWGQRIRTFPIVLVKYWKVAHWNAKKLLPKFQKLPPKFRDIFK